MEFAVFCISFRESSFWPVLRFFQSDPVEYQHSMLVIDNDRCIEANLKVEISDIATDSNNNIWIAIKKAPESGHGLFKFDGEKWENYKPENSQLHSENLTKLHVDRFDNLWIGSQDKGVIIFNENGIRY